MKVEVGPQCVGSGECELIASTVFLVEDDMKAHVTVPDAELTQYGAAINEAVNACPTAALKVIFDVQ